MECRLSYGETVSWPVRTGVLEGVQTGADFEEECLSPVVEAV